MAVSLRTGRFSQALKRAIWPVLWLLLAGATARPGPALPFTVGQFFDVIARYNRAVWPAQWFLVALAVALIALSFRKQPIAGRIVLGVLAFVWLWTGAIYHLGFFASINPGATVFGVAFILEAVFLAWVALGGVPPVFRARWNATGVAGGILIGYALVAYPLIGMVAGERYPALPTFGLPCPTTIFTLGLLLWADLEAPWRLVTIPLLWAALGWSAAGQFGVLEDYGLVVAGIVTLVVLAFRPRRPPAARPAERRAEPIGAGQGT